MLSLSFVPHGLIAFIFWWSLHVLGWRLFAPRKDLQAAILFFGLLPLILFLGTGLSAWRESYLMAVGVFFLLSLNYLILYPALQASSPTVTILCLLWANPQGLTLDDFIGLTNQNSLQKDRVEELEAAGLLVASAGGWTLTARGARLSFLFSLYRRALGLTEGKG